MKMNLVSTGMFSYVRAHTLLEKRVSGMFSACLNASVMSSRLHPWTRCGLKSVGVDLLLPAFQPRPEHSSRQVKAFA